MSSDGEQTRDKDEVACYTRGMPPAFARFFEAFRAHFLSRFLLILAIGAVIFPIVLMSITELKQEHLSVNEIVGERLSSYTSHIRLDPTGGATVDERFTYDFQDHSRSGLIRFIPRSAEVGGYLPADRGLHVLPVTRNGAAEPTQLKYTNTHLSIGIGNKETLVRGQQTYRLPYRVDHLVKRTNTADTIRFSPTETSFGVPIDAVSIVVEGPVAPLRADCHVGPSEEKTTTPCRTRIEGTTVRFQHIRWLEKGEGFFIEIDYPLGTFSAPLILEPAPLIPVWIIVILFHFALVGGFWFIFGRDHQGRGTIIPSDDLLRDVKPYEAGALLSQGPTYASFLGMILDLAERGAVKIDRFEGGGYQTLDVERVRGAQTLDAIEGDVLKRLFRYSTSDDPHEEEAGSASLDRYSDQTRLAFKLFQDRVYQRLVQRGWYSANILAVQLLSVCILMGWTYGLYLLLEGRVNDSNIHLIQYQILLLLPFLYFMPRLTQAGALARERVKGLAWYIRVAEKDRLEFHEGPQSLKTKPGKLLAYSVALNIQKDWKTQFLKGFGKTKKH